MENTCTILLMVGLMMVLKIQVFKCDQDGEDDDEDDGDKHACSPHIEPGVRKMLRMCTDFMWKSLGMTPISSISFGCLAPGQIIDAITASILADACLYEMGHQPKIPSGKDCKDPVSSSSSGSSSSSSSSSSGSSGSSGGCDGDESSIPPDEGNIGADITDDNNIQANGGSISQDDSDAKDVGFRVRLRSKERVREKRGLASSLPAYKWSLPVLFSFSLEQSGVIDVERVKTEVRRAMSVIQSTTCVRFVESNQNAQLIFYTSSSCASYTGKRANNAINAVYLGPECQYSAGQMLYLLVQTLGFFNEHQRPDRDDFITINPNNIPPTRLDAFITIPRSIATTFDLTYDYYSIMHQPQKFLSSNAGPTLETKDSLYQYGLGQRVELSFLDKVSINKMYCTDTCINALDPSCVNGGVRDPNACDKCSCPDGFSGIYCQDIQSQSTTECSTNVVDLTLMQSTTIQSPGYDNPRSYRSGVSCSWIVKALPASTISATFVGDFGIYCKDSSSCQHWVEIRHKKPFSSSGPRFCCNSLPYKSISSEDNEMMILFRTQDIDGIAGSNRGFRLSLSTSKPCPAWSIRVDVNSIGGRLISSLGSNQMTLDICKNYCSSQGDCIGFDFSLSSTTQERCYIYTDPSVFSVKYSTKDVIQYQLDRSNCPGTLTQPTERNPGRPISSTTTTTAATTATTTLATSTTTSERTSTTVTPSTTTKYTPPTTTIFLTSTSTSTTTTTLEPPCYRWMEMVDTQSIGGMQAFQINNLESCRSHCLSLMDGCMAFGMDVNHFTPTCWIFGGSSNLWPIRNSKMFLFVKRRCDDVPLPCPEPKISFDTSSIGGVKVTDVWTSTAYDCLSRCNDSTTQCYGFDFNYSELSCWLHLDATKLSQSYHNPGILQVLFQKLCPLRQEPTTTVTTAFVTRALTEPTVQGWTFTADTSSPGGNFILGLNSMFDCRSYCQNYDTCVGIDFQTRTSPPECWIHISLEVMNRRYHNPGVQQGVLERCPAISTSTTTSQPSTTTAGIVPPDRNSCPYWTVNAGKSSMGGVLQSQYTTIRSCLDFCLSLDSCAGFDYRDSQCWTHSDQTITNEIVNPFVTQVKVLDRCRGPSTKFFVTTTTASFSVTRQDVPCLAEWLKKTGQHSPGGEYVAGISTEEDCKTKCLSMIDCFGLDFNWMKSPGECWIHRTKSNMDTIHSDFSVVQYVLVKRCPDTSPCENKWIIKYGSYSPGGHLNPFVRTAFDCLQACIDDLSCVGVDVDSSGLSITCMVHSSVAEYLQVISDSRYSQYRISIRCPTQSLPSPCQDMWVIKKGFQSEGALKVAQPLTLLDCLSNCSSISYCVGAEFNAALSPPECWLHFDSSMFSRKLSNPNIVQYQIVQRCSNSWEKLTGGCGGLQASPGQMNPVCMTINKPVATCNVAITTFESSGRGWTLRYTNNALPCVTPLCLGSSQLVNFGSTPTCVVLGWSPWQQCSRWCGGGIQFRYFYDVSSGLYQTTNEEQRSCNVQPCR